MRFQDSSDNIFLFSKYRFRRHGKLIKVDSSPVVLSVHVRLERVFGIVHSSALWTVVGLAPLLVLVLNVSPCISPLAYDDTAQLA
jgi:hypothetical protein